MESGTDHHGRRLDRRESLRYALKLAKEESPTKDVDALRSICRQALQQFFHGAAQ